MVERDVTEEERRRLPEAGATTRALEPADEEDLRAMLAASRERRSLALVPYGGGTRQRYGEPLVRVDGIVRLARMAGLYEDGSLDGYVEVGAGTPLDALAAELARRGQMVVPRPVGPPGGTVGGWVAVGNGGPHRLQHGGVRDNVLGLRVVLADGRTIRTGGRVVKNVAGYDLTRLWTGSLGTLGVITSVRLRVWPLPQGRRTLALAAPTACGAQDAWGRLEHVAHVVEAEGWEPAALEIVAEGGAQGSETLGRGDGRPRLWVDLWHRPKAVQRAAQRIYDLAAQGGLEVVADVDGEAAEAVWWRWERAVSAAGQVQVRMSLPLSQATHGGMRAVRAMDALSERGCGAWAVSCGTATGVVRLFLRATNPDAWSKESTPEGHHAWAGERAEAGQDLDWVESLAGLRSWAEGVRGALVVEAGSVALRAALGAWGRAVSADAWRLAASVRAALDPLGLWSPGRMGRDAADSGAIRGVVG